MHYIPRMFRRVQNRYIDKLNPNCEWILDDNCVAYRKFDGKTVKIIDGEIFGVIRSQKPPENMILTEVLDSGESYGWLKDHKVPPQAIEFAKELPNGVYELVGPGIKGNREKKKSLTFIPHDTVVLENVPRTYRALGLYLQTRDIEGLIWQHPDGRQAKVLKKEYGMKRLDLDGSLFEQKERHRAANRGLGLRINELNAQAAEIRRQLGVKKSVFHLKLKDFEKPDQDLILEARDLVNKQRELESRLAR